MKSVGSRIKQMRIEKNLTQEELANNLNKRFNIKINKGMISKWENNTSEPRLEYARYIAEYFNVSLDFLIGINQVEKKASNENLEQHSNFTEQTIKPKTIAAHLPEGVELTEEEQKQLNDYIQFLLSKRNK